ncbi:MAG TPA: PHP domain-containing protein [Vicinamibacterales bacterium]|nr:PHP domain-containing protein [Vicinamibacterales bacterium]
MTRQQPQSQPAHGQGLIDLHLHTTASDGRCSPRQLVDRASAAGLTVLAVTDHDTTAASAEIATHAAAAGIEAISGIEVTAVYDGRDVHVLGYFVSATGAALQTFLATQRGARVARVKAIAARLAELGYPIDLSAMLDDAQEASARSLGRPQVARAMVAAGHVGSIQDAFDGWLGPGGVAFVPREGAAPEAVIEVIHEAGGLASLAHPGRTLIDDQLERLRDAGLDALEVFHSDHAPAQVTHYAGVAATLNLLCTGGSDFHGDPARAVSPGSTTLPADEWRRFQAARDRHA